MYSWLSVLLFKWNHLQLYDVITFLIFIVLKRKYLYNEKRYSKNENAILLYFGKPFK